jgi:nucleotide-binding universal stress UspA family protein
VATADGQRIVVGVNASRVAQHAVLWGTQEARLQRLDLIIAHVTPSGANRSPDTALDLEKLLNSSAAAASRREPSVAVGTLLLRGIVSEELTRLTKSAALLVVGIDSAKERSAHGALGSVEDRLLVHASCPVVTVSQNPRFGYDRRHRVIAVWTGGLTSENVLTRACREAVLSDAALTVLIPQSAAPSGQLGSADHDHLRAEALVRSAASAEGIRLDVIHPPENHIAFRLSQMSTEADLLVMACKHSDDRWSIRTGSLASTVMRKAVCPVMFLNSAAS